MAFQLVKKMGLTFMGEHQGDPYSPPVGSDQSKMKSGLMVVLIGIVSVVSGFVAFSATCAGLYGKAKPRGNGCRFAVSMSYSANFNWRVCGKISEAENGHRDLAKRKNGRC